MNSVSLNDALLAAQLLALDLAQSEEKKPTKIVSIETAGFLSSSSTKGKMPTSAPKLNPVPETPPDSSSESFLEILAAFMSATILLQILMTKNESNLNGAQNSVSNSLIQLDQVQVKKAAEQFSDYQAKYEAAQKKSLLGQIFGGIAAALCCLVAGLTGGLSAFLVAGIVTGVMMSPAMGKLDDAMKQAGFSALSQAFIKLSIVVVGAVLLCGISGAIEAATKEAGEEAAAGAAADGDGFLTRAYNKGATTTNLIASGGQLLTAVNPLGSFITIIAKACHASDETALLLGQIIGLFASIALTCGLSYATANTGNKAGEELMKTLRNTLNENQFRSLSATLNFFRATTMILSGAFQTMAGVTLLKQSKILGDMGETKKNQTLYQALISIMNQTTQSELKQFNSQMDVITQLSSQFNSFVEPGAQAAEILG